jgi:hypothetical protein
MNQWTTHWLYQGIKNGVFEAAIILHLSNKKNMHIATVRTNTSKKQEI